MSTSAADGNIEETLVALVDSGDIVGTWEWLENLTGPDLSQAKVWFAKNRRALLDRPYDYTSPGREARDAARPEGDWAIALCALKLCGPAAAAKAVPWGSYWTHQRAQGEAALVQMLWDMADRDWVAQFVRVASDVSPTSIENALEILGGVLRAVVVHHDLPCPSGRSYMKVWLSGVVGTTLTEKLSGDPLMPDLLFHHLASGDCGSTTGLPETVLELIQRGEVDRDAILTHIITLFTSPQRPASQLMLARVFDALAPGLDEIPGGLTYLLGVISSGHGPAGRILLPYAVSLIATPDDLADVAAVVAGRPETKQRQLLLAALDDEGFQAKVGTPAVLAAATALAQTEDNALAGRATRLIERLGGGAAAQEEERVPSGLWELPPTPPAETSKSYWGHQPTWESILNRSGPSLGELNDDDFAHFVRQTLTEMQEGRFAGGRHLVGWASSLLSSSRLGLTRLARIVPDLFLNGGLSQGWAPVLAVADECCSVRPAPAGLATMLRTLAMFAPEVPPQALPDHILALAAGRGESKMQLEARVLGSRLARLPIAEHLAQIRTHSPVATEPAYVPPPVRGLWQRHATLPPLPQDIRLAPESSGLAAVAVAFEQGFDPMGRLVVRGDTHCYLADAGFRDITRADVALGQLVAAIHRDGSARVRGSLAHLSARPDCVGVILAATLWTRGVLRLDRLSELPTSVEFGVARWQIMDRTGSMDYVAAEATLNASHPMLDNAVPTRADLPLIRPASLRWPEGRIGFVWATEVLQLAESNPTVLSTPTWADGTLDLDDLLHRMVEANGRLTSALDVLHALWRLRDFDPSRVTEVDGISLPLAFGYTLSSGERISDGAELVRLWMVSGGLPRLNAYEVDGTWRSDARPPLDWTGCDHVPPSLLDGDPWSWGWPLGVLRLMPRWPDRMVQGRADRSWTCPEPLSLVSDPIGIPILDTWFPSDDRAAMGNVEAADLARRGRLVPERFAAAAIGRHRGGGALKMGAVIERTRTLFDEYGCFAGMWPSALAMAAALCAEQRKPSELSGLLSLLVDYAHEVPDPVIPEGLRVYAAGKGSSKSQAEARRLVTALAR